MYFQHAEQVLIYQQVKHEPPLCPGYYAKAGSCPAAHAQWSSERGRDQSWCGWFLWNWLFVIVIIPNLLLVIW